MNIGERIRARRKDLRLSVDDVAKKLGKNRATVYRYESNDIENLPTTILEPLAKILKTTPGYLMGWTDEKLRPLIPETEEEKEKIELALKEQQRAYDANELFPPLSKKNELDIGKQLENILNKMDSNTALAYDGEPMDPETQELVRDAIESSLRLTKKIAKKKFTPKKYRDWE
jgi:transcriptional regulator with XRE-family HTH domain